MDAQFHLTEYINHGMDQIVGRARKDSLKNPREAVFLVTYLRRFRRAKKIRAQYEAQGRHIPPFLIASITKNCNLSCRGCYAKENAACSAASEKTQLTCGAWDSIFAQANALGVAFILLAGGEPLLRKEVLECAGQYKSIIFPVFTNGTMIRGEYLRLFDRKRNLVPVLSLEGNRTETDGRRGDGVYETLTRVMEQLRRRNIFFGVSITMTRENIETVTGEPFIRQLSQRGCRLVFFVEYVPVTPESRHLAPTQTEQELLLRRQAQLQDAFGHIIFLAFPGDEKQMGGCLAAGRGFFHINADGGAEPCPFSPFSDVSLKEISLLEALDSPLFHRLEQSGLFTEEHAGGCLLFEHRQEVEALLGRSGEAATGSREI